MLIALRGMEARVVAVFRSFGAAVFAAMLAAGPGAAQSVRYGTSGDWELFRNSDNGQVVSCHSTLTTGPGTALLFEHDAGHTIIGFRTPRSNVNNGRVEVLVAFDGNPASAQLVEMPQGPEWRGYRTPNSEPDGLLDLFSNANSISFSYDVPGQGMETVTFPLRGSNAASRKTYDCVQNPQAARPAQPLPTAVAPAPQTYSWIHYAPGQLGPHLVMAGTMADGMGVFVCGAYLDGGFHPGMTGMWMPDTCSIGYGGVEHTVAPFQVLGGQGRWQPYQGTIPPGAVEGGHEANGARLSVCRSIQGGMALAGKFRPGFRGCNIGDGGSEVAYNPFELLTF